METKPNARKSDNKLAASAWRAPSRWERVVDWLRSRPSRPSVSYRIGGRDWHPECLPKQQLHVKHDQPVADLPAGRKCAGCKGPIGERPAWRS